MDEAVHGTPRNQDRAKHHIPRQQEYNIVIGEWEEQCRKRSRYLNIKYFYITDKLEPKEVKIEYCPTDDMIGDFNTKPLQGSKFIKFKQMILND